MRPHRSARHPVNLRSVALGLVGVVFICGLTPYNDFVVDNTYFTGNFLPIGLVLFFLLFVMLVNAPLSRFVPRVAFGKWEMAVALGMTLVSCAIPSSGLMRLLPSQLVAPWYHAGANPAYREVLDRAHLPDWFWPRFKSSDTTERANDPVVQDFWRRADAKGDTFVDHWLAVPWRAWARPAVVWGVLVAALFGAIICLAILVREQWVENERLPFPLATLYVSLIEPPEPGRAFGGIFRSPTFWIAWASVFAVHGVNAMHLYDGRHFPEIPLSFNLINVTTEPPWSYIDWFVRSGRFFFTVIGITYFVNARVAFSMWFFMLLWQIPKMAGGTLTVQEMNSGWHDQSFGAMLAFAGAVVWVGRHHWVRIAREMFGRMSSQTPRSHRIAGWSFLACLTIAAAWLLSAGATIIGTVIILFMYVLLMFVLMRIIAETGLLFVHFLLPMWQPWGYLFRVMPSMATARETERPFFLTAFFHTLLASSERENIGVYSIHAMRVVDLSRRDEELAEGRRPGVSFVVALVAALIVGYVVAGASTLYTEYTYASTLSREPQTPINPWAMNSAALITLNASKTQMESGRLQDDNHGRLKHFTAGAGIVALLSFLNLRVASWPFHPLGYLLIYAWTTWLMWPSIFVGWLAKVSILRFGGARMFSAARPLFVGLIVGECSAAGFWLIVSLVRVWMGLEYHAVNLLPM